MPNSVEVDGFGIVKAYDANAIPDTFSDGVEAYPVTIDFDLYYDNHPVVRFTF